MKKIIGVLLLAVLLTGCSQGYVDSEHKDITNHIPLIEGELYYIPHEYNERDFAIKYDDFLKDYPDLKVFDIETDPNEDAHNSIHGYFIFTEKK